MLIILPINIELISVLVMCELITSVTLASHDVRIFSDRVESR